MEIIIRAYNTCTRIYTYRKHTVSLVNERLVTKGETSNGPLVSLVLQVGRHWGCRGPSSLPLLLRPINDVFEVPETRDAVRVGREEVTGVSGEGAVPGPETGARLGMGL